eukprot:CAMPEP_0118865410 /NCGR_PEP_ID=MMETSP1163-20130328/9686_1 /TAXON_ID=124430 /ORGANISM="Phaeomonas parva, Strain CCMP2877" /LENGTH=88 /DNA_ID=CAMNT_0006799637 /DNA_START=1 /DNA_END=264 /DNA_ORIENTATION=-
MEAICIMLEAKPDWDNAKKLLNDSQFLDRLKTYDKDNISPSILKKIRAKYIPREEFQVVNVAKVSSAAKGMCMWVHAMDVYASVAKEV